MGHLVIRHGERLAGSGIERVRAQLITHGNDYAVAHSLADGKEVWRLGDLNPKDRYNATLRFVTSPVAVADLIVIPTAKNDAVVGISPDASGVSSGLARRTARGRRRRRSARSR